MPFEQHSAWKFTKNGDSIDKIAIEEISIPGGPLGSGEYKCGIYTPASMVF